MAADTADKFLQTKLALSRRAFGTGEPSRLSLLDAVKTINSRFTTPAERRALGGTKAIECRSYRDCGEYVGLYLVGYIPDDKIGIVPHTQEELSLLDPPDDADFLDGELMALIAEEAVIVCRLGLYESAINNYVNFLGPLSGLAADDCSYLFRNRTDIDKLRMIQADGVASIRFEGVANSASAAYAAHDAERGRIARLVEATFAEIRALTYGDRSATRDPENLKVEVFLKFDGRAGTEVDQAEISEIAESISDADDGFTIKTLKGRTIRPNDVLLNKKISVRRFGKSVAFTEVFAEMEAYFRELTAPED